VRNISGSKKETSKCRLQRVLANEAVPERIRPKARKEEGNKNLDS
jgi:hypothetical protein